MLTLSRGSACDVCAEEYGPHCLPHSIPCGHVLCKACCNTIVEKTSPRLSPVCPFCREHFSSDAVRLIRTDSNSSGWSTPRSRGGTIEANIDVPSDQWFRKEDRSYSAESGNARTRAEARRLEYKVAKVAAKKCSVEEVTTLHKELQEWLQVKSGDQTSSLSLSAALLRAILMNHLAHSESSRISKATEADLNQQLDDLEIANGKLDAELRRQKLLCTQKVQECQTLRTELSRLKIVATTLGAPPPRPITPAPPQSEPHREPVPTRPPSASPTTPSSTYTSPIQPSLSRFNSTHSRSISMHSGASPSTPSPSTRAQTPSYSMRSQTPSTRTHHTSTRSQTPSIRSQTPSIRSQTPSLHVHTSSHRSQTPAPPVPPLPPKQRRLSQSSPPKMLRSSSEGKEKETVHQLWIPSMDPDLHDLPSPSRKHSRFPQSTGMSSSSAAAATSRTLAQAAAAHRYTTMNDT